MGHKKNKILLVVDTQKGVFDERLYEFEKVRMNIKLLISEARKSGIEVAYVRHDDGPGTELARGGETMRYMKNLHLVEMKRFLIRM